MPHNSTPQIINNLNNTATNIWSNLLQSPNQLDIDFQITDLPSGQLGEANITDYDENGNPTAGTIEERGQIKGRYGDCIIEEISIKSDRS